MDKYLELVFSWEGSTDDLEEYLGQGDQKRAMVRFMADVLTDAARRHQVEVHIVDSLGVFEQEVDRLSLFLTDPLLIDRWVMVLGRLMRFVPRNSWVRGKILLDRLRHIARSTQSIRTQIAMAHLMHPLKMSGRHLAARSSLNLLS